MRAQIPLSLTLAAVGVLWLSGCPNRGVVCTEGLSACQEACVDLASDRRHCGGCGVSCQVGQMCQEGSCLCEGGREPCEGSCVVTSTDPRHCGGCGQACAPGQVCEQRACKAACELGSSTRCGDSCVDLSSSTAHCGGCGASCDPSQSCRQGSCTYDVVAACFTNGQLTGLRSDSLAKGPNAQLGTGPAALASLEGVLLVADGIDNALYQARLSAGPDGGAFAPLPESVPTGAVPNQVWVDTPFVYLVNAASGTLQVLRKGASDAGFAADAGLGLGTVAELNFGPNTYPEAIAQVGSFLYVPLYGGFGASGASAGQSVKKVDVSEPHSPVVAGTFDLSALDLKPFDGGSPVPRPYAAIAHRGKVYVALNNLNPDTYAVEGPGLLARIDPGTGALDVVELGEGCLNPAWLASDGTHLAVSCQGRAVYSPSFALESVEKTGVVLFDENGTRTATWNVACPAGGDGGCLPVQSGRLAIQDGKVFVGDQNGGRIFVLEISNNQLVERAGFNAARPPVQACAVDPMTNYSNVSDVLAVP
ncbi:MAG: MXAN_6577-like cysteine-rich protein [Myxococcota bacterium]